MSKKKNRTEFLKGLGLNPDAPNLVPEVPTTGTTVADTPDNHTIPAENIVFDAALLQGYDNLEDPNVRKDAVDHIFKMYKSLHRDTPRNSLLWKRINQFVNQERLSKKTGGVVKEKVKAGREERDLAQVIATLGITAEDLIELAKKKQEGS